MGFELQRLTHVHRAIVDLAVQGLSRGQIAEMMGRTPESVGLVLNSPIVQEELARRRGQLQAKADTVQVLGAAEAGRILNEASTEAASKVRELLMSADEKVALASAKDILDRTYGKVIPDAATNGITVLNVDQLNMLVQTMKESKELEAV